MRCANETNEKGVAISLCPTEPLAYVAAPQNCEPDGSCLNTLSSKPTSGASESRLKLARYPDTTNFIHFVATDTPGVVLHQHSLVEIPLARVETLTPEVSAKHNCWVSSECDTIHTLTPYPCE